MRRSGARTPVGSKRGALPLLAALCWLGAGCSEEATPLPYETVGVERRDIVVSAEAAGIVEPEVTVEVKSKASGEILEMRVDTGDRVERGTLLLRIDARQPRNHVAEAEAGLQVARARLSNAESQLKRAEKLFHADSMSEAEHDGAILDRANAHAEVVRSEIALENARIELGDTEIHAPIEGSVIAKEVERGQVISSATSDVSGGTVLLQMADLSRVRIRTLVDETDIGSLRPSMPATVVADAYPDNPFPGTVLKIEPQAVSEQNVTMFPVLVGVENPDAALRPGMNAEVEIHIGVREQVLAIPNGALRGEKYLEAAAEILGLTMDEVRADLASGDGASPSAEGRAFVVFVQGDDRPRARRVRTGLTDLDASEILSGLDEGEWVLMLPSDGLLRSQQEFRDRVTRVRGSGLPGVRKAGKAGK